MPEETNNSKDRLIRAMMAIRDIASNDLNELLQGRGEYSKLSRWMSQKLSQLGEGGVSDQSVSNWLSGRMGPSGLDDNSARKIGVIFGLSPTLAAPLFKLYLAGGFELPSSACSHSESGQCRIALGIIESLSASELDILRSEINQKLGDDTVCLIFRVQELFEEDEFVYRMPSMNSEQSQRYRAIYRGIGGELSEIERRLIADAIERETGSSAEGLFDDCDKDVQASHLS